MTAPRERPLPGPEYEDEHGPRNLPAVPGEAGPAILEGRVVEGSARSVPLQAVHVVRTVARHEHTRTAGRNAGYIGIGAAVVAKRLWESRHRPLRAAHPLGRGGWRPRIGAGVGHAADQVPEGPAHPPRGPGRAAAEGRQGAAGDRGRVPRGADRDRDLLAVATRNAGEVAAPVKTVARIAEWAAIAFSVTWGPFLLGAPWIVLGVLYWAGRSYANASATSWSVAGKGDGEDAGLVITADTIVLALQHLPVPALKRRSRTTGGPRSTRCRSGTAAGYSAVFSVPLGVTAEMIADQRPVLARNVHRDEVEVWPSDAAKAGAGPAGTVAVWVADPGVLSQAGAGVPAAARGRGRRVRGRAGRACHRAATRSLIPVVGNNFVPAA